MNQNISGLILSSRAYLNDEDKFSSLKSIRKKEEEGGCGVIGVASSHHIPGKHLLQPLRQMRNRGNGKGGGIAACGLSYEQLGVTREILDNDYLIQIAYLDPSSREEVEKNFIYSTFKIDVSYPLQMLSTYKDVEGLEVEPPMVWRYFCRVKDDVLQEFIQNHSFDKSLVDKNTFNKNSLNENLLNKTLIENKHLIEDEIVYQNTYLLNKTFYSSVGTKKAFVLSHGKNMLVLKIVGYAEQVVEYYKLEDFKANIWIGHQRYPTKGKVWHPGGAHPFIGLHEALVHNGDFANYHSISEYLAQRNIAPLFLTDTEVAALLFDLWGRVYNYPIEYLIEAMAPTTERDFEMLPEEKKKIYQAIQAAHIHGSPDGPWFFIIARNHIPNKEFQLIGITDTSMLRPQVFAISEGEIQIGLIASEKQAIDAYLESLWKDNPGICPFADIYWNARGGSHTDGGAFVFSVDSKENKLTCRDKFGHVVAFNSPNPKNNPNRNPSLNNITVNLKNIFTNAKTQEFLSLLQNDMENFKKEIQNFAINCNINNPEDADISEAIEIITNLMDKRYPVYPQKRNWLIFNLEKTLEDMLRKIPLLEDDAKKASLNGKLNYHRINWSFRNKVSPPKKTTGEEVLVIDAANFPIEGEDSLARHIVLFYQAGWKNFIIFGLRGQRFIGCGLGPITNDVTIHVYGRAGDYLGSGLDGAQIFLHGTAQDQLAQIIKSGTLVVFGDVGQTFMYGAKGGEVYVMGNAAGRPLINAVGSPKTIINGTCLDYLAESFMAGDPLQNGGFVIINGIKFNADGEILDLEAPYPGGNLLSLASGGAIYIRDPLNKIKKEQLNGGRFALLADDDWNLIKPYLEKNEILFGITVSKLLSSNGKELSPFEVYRKVEPVRVRELESV